MTSNNMSKYPAIPGCNLATTLKQNSQSDDRISRQAVCVHDDIPAIMLITGILERTLFKKPSSFSLEITEEITTS